MALKHNCVHRSSPQYLSVLVGTNNLLDGGTRHQVAEIFIHEGYNAGEWYINDIAVVRVADPFVYDSNTSPVALPEQDQQSPGGSPGTLVGWGIAYVRKFWSLLRI
jgi:Trypsin